jgi:hypothetical protein
LLAAVVVLTIALDVVWETIRGAEWISRLCQSIAMAEPLRANERIAFARRGSAIICDTNQAGTKRLKVSG